MNNPNYITIIKSSITEQYLCNEPIPHEFYLLYLLFTETLPPISLELGQLSEHHVQKNNGIDFCKNSMAKCLVTSQLFIHKHNGYIEIFSNYDLKNTDDLCLPKSPKLTMTAKNFINFMIQKNQYNKQKPKTLFIIIDHQGHAHLTTNLESINKVSFLTIIQKKLARFFNKPTN